jgi:DnaK suppressor protein
VIDGDEKLALKGLLEAKRRELERQIELQSEAMKARAGCAITDAADAASFLESRHRAAALYAHHSQVLSEVDAALERLQRGVYGIDEVTGEPIPLERLRAVPWRRRAE